MADLTTEEEKKIESNADRMEDVPVSYIDAIGGLEEEIFSLSLPLIDALGFDENGFLLITENAGVPDQIANGIVDVIFGTEYLDFTQLFLDEFDVQASNSIDILRSTLEDPGLQATDDAVNTVTGFKVTTTDIFLGGTFITLMTEPIRTDLEGLVGGLARKSDVVRALRGRLVSGEQGQSLIKNNAANNSRDVFAQSDRAFSVVQAQETKPQWFVYRGGTVRDSRKFCVKRNGKYYHRNEVREWGNIRKWQGRKRNTSPGNIFVNLGGHNCLHSIMAVSVTKVPKSVLKRNIRSGNFKPTDIEKEILQL